MKYLYLGILLLPFLAHGQKNFAPMGAEWIYDSYSMDCTYFYTKYEVTEEVEIDQKDCSIIFSSYWDRDVEEWMLTGDSLIVYEEEGQVFFQEGSEFYLMYDFTLQSGDTLTYYDPISRGNFTTQSLPEDPSVPRAIELIIGSIDTIEVNGEEFKVFNTFPADMYSENCALLFGIIENIGSNFVGLNGRYCTVLAVGCYGNLECYRSDEVNYSLTDESCDIVNSIKSEFENSNRLRIFPNPTQGYVNVNHTLDQDPELIIIYNHLGQVVNTLKYSKNLDVTPLNSGVYIFAFKANNSMLTKKIVVN